MNARSRSTTNCRPASVRVAPSIDWQMWKFAHAQRASELVCSTCHARALGLQLCLAAVPLLIALNGLATKLGDPIGGVGWWPRPSWP